MISSSTKTIGLIATVWTEQGEGLKTLVIENGKISRVLDGNQPITDIPGINMITLEENMVVFPGLINLHTHTTYNILPIWESNAVWTNRFQWRNNADYKQNIGNLLYYIQSNWKDDPDTQFVASFAKLAHAALNKALPAASGGAATSGDAAALLQSALSVVNTAYAVISEIQAVAGGTTLIQETLNLDKENPDDRSFIIRNTGDDNGLNIPATKDINSVIDFFAPDVKPKGVPDEDTSAWTPVKQSPYTDFVQSVNGGNSRFYSSLVHVGEGKSGFVKGSTADPYSKKELELLFQSLRSDLTTPGNLAGANLSITHGCGIDFADEALLDFLSANNISLVWSPVSNLLLYRDTLDVRKLLDRQITVCLGSDWSPSGSKHVLDELKFAKFVNDLLGFGIGNADLFRMVSTNPVKTLGIAGNGAIAAGNNADLFVLRKKSKTADSLEALLAGTDGDIEFVMVNGRIVFGLTGYFSDRLNVDFQGFGGSEGNHAAQRGVSINSHLSFDLTAALSMIDTLLQRYCATVINKPQMKRTRFLAADDAVYQSNIDALKTQLTGLYS
jgi:5-methylthioadenosine/S-adenosylhomocysteine deaminase